MDVGFAAIGQLARTLPASHPVLVHRLASLLHASFRPHLAARPLRFAITSPPSGCEEDLHLQAVDHARHTKKNGTQQRAGFVVSIESAGYFFAYQSEFNAVNDCHFSGRSSSAKMAVTGHTGTHAPQSMHSAGLM
jgi:hypothetical protein